MDGCALGSTREIVLGAEDGGGCLRVQGKVGVTSQPLFLEGTQLPGLREGMWLETSCSCDLPRALTKYTDSQAPPQTEEIETFMTRKV